MVSDDRVGCVSAIDAADAWMRDQKIGNPAGFAQMLAPGRSGAE